MTRAQKGSFLHEHGLSVAVGTILIAWLVLYAGSDPSTHAGAFFGNAIADWLGSLVLILGTKFWYERGSPESRQPRSLWRRHAPEWLHEHSLSVVLIITGLAWIWWYSRLDPNGKTGQVVGNIVSEWTQILSLVWFTKYLVEKGSKESRRK